MTSKTYLEKAKKQTSNILSAMKDSALRLLTVQSAIIVLCDLALYPLYLFLRYLTEWFRDYALQYMTKLNLNKVLMLQNPNIIGANIDILQKTQMVGLTWLITVVSITAIVLTLLNYIQWTHAANIKPTSKQGLWFLVVESLWMVISTLIFAATLFYLIDPNTMLLAILLWALFTIHVTLSLHNNLLITKPFKDYKKIFKLSYTKGFRWAFSYVLFIVVLLISQIIGLLSVPLNVVFNTIYIPVLLVGFSFWRMTTFKLVTSK